MYEIKRKIGKVLTSKSVRTGPSSYEKRIYRAAVSQRLRNTALISLRVPSNARYFLSIWKQLHFQERVSEGSNVCEVKTVKIPTFLGNENSPHPTPPHPPTKHDITIFREHHKKKKYLRAQNCLVVTRWFPTKVSSTLLYFPCCPPLPSGLFSSWYFEIFSYFSPLSVPCSCELIYGDDIVGISRSRRDSPWLHRPSFHSMGICFKVEAFLILSIVQRQTRLFTCRSLEVLLFEIKNIITKLSSLEFLAPSSHVKFMPPHGKPRAVVKLTLILLTWRIGWAHK